MSTIEQNIKRIINQEIFTNASTFVADMQATELCEQLPATFENLLQCSIKDDWETPVRDAIADITPAGLFDVCECVLGCDLLDNDGNAIGDSEEADETAHDAVNRGSVIAAIESDNQWQEVAEHLDIEPHTDEALQHWLVSDWLAELLDEVGALVATDIMGFNIWGRTECGQSLEYDSDLKRVAVRVEERLKDII